MTNFEYNVSADVMIGVDVMQGLETYRKVTISAGTNGLTDGIGVSLRTQFRNGEIASTAEELVYGDASYHFIPWNELDNVGLLAQMFRAERVDVFQQIVELAGLTSRKQDAIKTLTGAD